MICVAFAGVQMFVRCVADGFLLGNRSAPVARHIRDSNSAVSMLEHYGNQFNIQKLSWFSLNRYSNVYWKQIANWAGLHDVYEGDSIDVFDGPDDCFGRWILQLTYTNCTQSHVHYWLQSAQVSNTKFEYFFYLDYWFSSRSACYISECSVGAPALQRKMLMKISDIW